MIKNKFDYLKEYDNWLNFNNLLKVLDEQKSINKAITFRTNQINKFKKLNLNLIAHTNIICEHTWFFKNQEQADKAHKIFKNTKLDGWFYSIKDLQSTIKFYEKNFKTKFPRIDFF